MDLKTILQTGINAWYCEPHPKPGAGEVTEPSGVPIGVVLLNGHVVNCLLNIQDYTHRLVAVDSG